VSGATLFATAAIRILRSAGHAVTRCGQRTTSSDNLLVRRSPDQVYILPVDARDGVLVAHVLPLIRGAS